MSNAITATIGLDIAPLKKGTDEATTLLKATAKKEADAAKARLKQGEKDFADSVKRKADLEKASADRVAAYHAEASKKAKAILENGKAELGKKRDFLGGANGVAGAATGLAGAGGAGDLAAGAFQAIGSLAGPVAGVAAGVGLIASGMYSASEDARAMRLEFAELARATQGKSSGSANAGELRSGASNISETLRQKTIDRLAAQEKWGSWIGETNSTSLTGSLGESAGEGMDHWFGGEAGPSDKSQLDDRVAAAKKERYRLTIEATKADQADADITEHRLQVSEREAEIYATQLQAAREIAAVREQMKKEGYLPDTIAEATEGMQRRAEAELRDLQRKGEEVWTAFADSAEDSAARSAIAVEAVTSQIGAMRKELQQAKKEMERETVRSGIGNEEQKREHFGKANEARERAAAITQQISVAQRALDNARVDAANAEAQAAIQTLGLTNRTLAAKQQMALLDKQLADLAERKQKAEEGAKVAIEAQMANIRQQQAQLQHQQNQISPQERHRQEMADKRAERRGQRNQRAAKAIANERQRTADRNGGKGNDEFFKRSRAARAQPGGPHIPDAFDNEVFRQKIMSPRVPINGPGVDKSSDAMSRAADALMQLLPILQQQQTARVA